MIEKINSLKNNTENTKAKALCEKASSTINSGIYNNIPSEAKIELEKAVIENLFEDLSAIEDDGVQDWLKNSKRIWAVKNIGVREAINTLSTGETKQNASLQQVLESFKSALEKEPEVLLYENFISDLQSFKYFPKVGNSIDAIKDRVDNYEADVSITKIVETMKKTRSHYLVPLIEDLVQNYLDNKTQQTKSSLKEGLIKFSYDPFVRDLINLVTADATELQLEYANAQCDIEKVYSPILYLGENEAIFGVKGSYYIKKGNTISRLNKDAISRIDPEFKSLCEAINNPNVIINGKDITIYEGSDKAIISEDKVILNDSEFTPERFKNSAEIAQWTRKGNFLSLVETFRSNFNEIAEVDFVKRVFLKEEREYAADIFKLRGNISVATYNPQMGKGTFYRNINPIQAKNLMMEHLRFDVSQAFKEILPNEDKINEEIENTKTEYSNYIADLEKRITEFQINPFNESLNTQLISALSEELEDIKNEYKDYLNMVESYIRIPSENMDEAMVSLEINGPLNIEVDGTKYTVPIPQTQETPGQGEFGSEVGVEDIEGEPASAITFDDPSSELLGDSPSIQADEVNLGSAEAEADAEAAEAEADLETGEEGVEGAEGDIEGAEGDIEGAGADVELPGEEIVDGEGDITDVEGGEEIPGGDDDIKIEDEIEVEDKDGEEPKDEDKIEDSTSNSKPPKKKKVYLKKKKESKKEDQ